MKTIKRFFLFALCALFFANVHNVNAQVTIGGETEPVKGATLDLSPSGGYVGGLKLPNVSLTKLTEIPASFTDGTSIVAANLKGLQVYNTNTTLGEGVYTWNGNCWVANSLGSSQYIENRLNVFPTNTVLPTGYQTVYTFTAPTSGLYYFGSYIAVQYTNYANYRGLIEMIVRNDASEQLAIGTYAFTSARSSTASPNFICYLESGKEYRVDWYVTNTLNGSAVVDESVTYRGGSNLTILRL